MLTIRLFTLIATVVLALGCESHRGSSRPSVEGTMHGGGGGDPLAVEFIALARLLARAQASGRIDLGVSDATLEAKIAAIAASLETKSPLVEFPAGQTVPCFGAEKLGCVDDRGVIRFARDGWRAADSRQKLEVSTMELVKALSGTDRYSVADAVSRTLEYQERSGPTDIINPQVKFDASDQALVTENSLRMINRALSLASAKNHIPQFDLSLADKLPNPISTVRYDATSDSEDQCKVGSWERGIAVSAVTSLTPLRRAEIYVVHERFERCPADKGIAKLAATVFYSSSMHDEVTDRFQAISPYSRSDLGPKLRPLREYLAPSDADPVFKPCERLALNEAIARAAGDRSFEKTVKLDRTGWQSRGYELLSFLGTGRRLEGNAQYLISLLVKYDQFRIPYTYSIRTRAVGAQCRIVDVTSR